MNSKLLTPLNKLWFKFGMILGAIVSPIVMAAVFFLVVTPIGLIMRVMGKDLLEKKYNKKKQTYWIKRSQSFGDMKRQF
jgi:large-conductance mechanosensitive channel